MPVEIRKSQERLNFFNLSWLWPVVNGLDFRIVHLQAFRANDKAQEVGLVNVELALFDLHIEMIAAEATHDFLYLLQVFVMSVGIDQYVV